MGRDDWDGGDKASSCLLGYYLFEAKKIECVLKIFHVLILV